MAGTAAQGSADAALLQERVHELEGRLAWLAGQNIESITSFAGVDYGHFSAAQSVPSTSLPELFEHFGARLFSLPQVDGCAIILANEENQTLVTAHLKLGEELVAVEKIYRGYHHQFDQPDVNMEVFRSGRPILVTADNRRIFGVNTQMRFQNMKMRSLLVIPLMASSISGKPQIIGVVSVFSHHHLLELTLSETISQIAQDYAWQIRALWQHQLFSDWGRKIKAMHEEIRQHIAFITAMNSIISVEEVYSLISKRFLKRFGFDMVGILMAKQEELAIVHIAFSDHFHHLQEPFESFRATTRYGITVPDSTTSIAFLNNQRFLFDDVAQITHLTMTKKDSESIELLRTMRTLILVPICLNGQPIGILWLGTLDQPAKLPESDLALIELLASYISTAIRNAEAHALVEEQKNRIEILNRDLQSKIVLLNQLAHKDRLTGLNNFGSFEEELKRRTLEYNSDRSDGSLSAILIDIDHFKRFNDTFGHPAGNQVLQEIATRILKSMREIDFVARYGGEEFVVLLPQCDLEGAVQIAERIRSRVGRETFVIDSREHTITLSGGCGEVLPSESGYDFINRVDAALYAAKQNGRNRIETACELCG
ncbi:MAG: diguanylate cyclase [Proteobacteria bacterium]|nr:diguanylate cyclase [Pseudomonadota bacterium]